MEIVTKSLKRAAITIQEGGKVVSNLDEIFVESLLLVLKESLY